MSFENTVEHLAGMVQPKGCEISPAAQKLATLALTEIDERYGQNSERTLCYHNALHAVDVCRRGIRLANILYPHIVPEYRENLYDLILLAGVGHDYEQDYEKGINERLSADYIVGLAGASYEPHMRDSKFTDRLFAGVMATEVSMQPDGEIVQPNLREGDPDPLRLIMASADINGIAMEGSARMIKDAVNLSYEIYENPSPQQIYRFMLGQADFLRQRLDDERVRTSLAYYFPHNTELVYASLQREFQPNIKAAMKVARNIQRHPELESGIDRALSALHYLPASRAVGKLVRSKLLQ